MAALNDPDGVVIGYLNPVEFEPRHTDAAAAA